jgi:hypothetical protein
MQEIQHQLSRDKLAEIKKPLKYSEVVPAPQKRLIESLLTLSRPTLKEEMGRRTEAINAVAAYSLFEEGKTCRLQRDKCSSKDLIAIQPIHRDTSIEGTDATKSVSSVDDQLVAAIQSVIKPISKDRSSKAKAKRLLFCFICLGQPELDIVKQTYKFASHGDVTKYIKWKHLQHISILSDIQYNICNEQFACKMHLQRHAIDIHLTVT